MLLCLSSICVSRRVYIIWNASLVKITVSFQFFDTMCNINTTLRLILKRFLISVPFIFMILHHVSSGFTQRMERIYFFFMKAVIFRTLGFLVEASLGLFSTVSLPDWQALAFFILPMFLLETTA